jgi:hypothetical protein
MSFSLKNKYPMFAEFKEIKPFVHEMKLVDMSFTVDDILDEVNSADWQNWHCISNTRYSCPWSKATFGPIISELRNFFVSKQFQDQLIDTLGQQETFWTEYWKHDKQQFKNRLRPLFECDMDLPGFVMQPHLDNRSLVAVGMCHFTKTDNVSTIFYTNEQQANPLHMPAGHGVGWLAANLHNTWHSGHNNSSANRFSIKFGSQIDFT